MTDAQVEWLSKDTILIPNKDSKHYHYSSLLQTIKFIVFKSKCWSTEMGTYRISGEWFDYRGKYKGMCSIPCNYIQKEHSNIDDYDIFECN